MEVSHKEISSHVQQRKNIENIKAITLFHLEENIINKFYFLVIDLRGG